MTTRKLGRALKIGGLAMAVVVALGACGHVFTMIRGTDAVRPAAEEFGFGPRASAAGTYTAVLEPVEPLKVRKLQTVRVRITDVNGTPIDGANITVDGGMPEHGHGLPTRPRVTRNAGQGVYEIEGVRFNMGGWWEFKLAIDGGAGADSITFNLDL